MNKHLNIKISGRVHGVGFRWCAHEQYVDLGLAGKADNVPGGVLLDVEGPEDKLQQLIEWSRKGPSGAYVENVEITEISEPFVPLKMG